MNIIIDSRDLIYTVDTYQTLNDEDFDYQLVEDYNEQNNTSLEYNDFDWSYDTVNINKQLAINSVELLNEHLIDDIIKSITLKDNGSPKYYNYTTDWYTADWNIDKDNLVKYINNNYDDFVEFFRDEWSSTALNVNFNTKQYIYLNKPSVDMFDNEDVIVVMVDYYTRSKYSYIDYLYDMLENHTSVLYENTTMQLNKESVK